MKNISKLLIAIIVLSSCKKEPDTLFKLRSAESTGVVFNNRIIETDSTNILTEEYIFNGGGVGVGDFDNDGRPDLFFTGNQVSNALFLNKGEFRFKDVSAESGIMAEDRWNTGVAVVDINADGWMDIYVCSAMMVEKDKRANLLFINKGLNAEGIPEFVEAAATYGIAETGNSMAATFFDYDKDGFLDLYVLNNEQTHILPTNYRKKVTDGSAVSNDRLYHNNGQGTFTDVTAKAGINIEGFGLGVAVADLNYDTWPDIYVSNDYLTNDLLYINNGDGSFSNNIENLIKHQSKFSMGSDISDYNNDGLLDIVTLDMLGETNQRMKTTISNNNYISNVLNERWDYQYQYMRNMLHMGNGPGVPFSEIGLLAGMPKTDWSWSPLFVDMDNDGFRDLLITNGFPRDITDMDFANFRLEISRYVGPAKILDSIPIVKIPNYAYRNKGDLTFEDVSKSWGLDVPSFSNGAAFADLDMDGDMDYVVNNINDEAFIFENTLDHTKGEHNFLKIDLKGPLDNPQGIGAKLVIRFDSEKFQYYEHHLTRGYMSSVENMIHFGLGSNESFETIEILWPDGRYQKIKGAKNNQVISLCHKDAKRVDSQKLSFPFLAKKAEPIFSEVSSSLGIDFTHLEQDIVDYNVQRVLPHKLTQNGPCIAVGDINGDTYDDFIVGSSANFSPMLFSQKSDGTFSQEPLFTDKEDKKYEEQDMVLFDLENDGDLDLYLVSGSNEFPAESNQYNDRLFINNGKGEFKFAVGKMPVVKSSGSVVRAEDFDKDGFTDLFIGGRTPIAQYPIPDKSFLLKNNRGILEDFTDRMALGLRNVGMVADAVWTDLDNDGLSELVVVGEFMPITIFKNNKTSFTRLETPSIKNYLGWWKSIATGDFDNDGDFDLIVGNTGMNNLYRASSERPVSVIVKDFDNNGSIDPIMFAYFKDDKGVYRSYPVNFWGDLSKQSPLFRTRFDYYKDYANTTKEGLLSEEELKGAIELYANCDETSYVENLGNGNFKLTPLPMEAQQAPINDLIVSDFDNDGTKDVLMIGNDYGNETFIGRSDAFNGLLLKGNGKGMFQPDKPYNNGFLVSGDAKSMVELKSALGGTLYIVTQNRGKILVFQKIEKDILANKSSF